MIRDSADVLVDVVQQIKSEADFLDRYMPK
jgi:hypothetical protein